MNPPLLRVSQKSVEYKFIETEERENPGKKVHADNNDIIGELDLFEILEASLPPVSEKRIGLRKIWDGSQAGFFGEINKEKATAIFKNVNMNRAPGVRFNFDRVGETVTGGTCSATALDLIENFFQETAGREDIKRKQIKKILWEFRFRYSQSNDEFRHRQAVFNSIERNNKVPCDDFKQAKIASLAGFHGRRIVFASKEFDLRSNSNVSAVALDIIKNMPTGVYIARSLLPADNHKEEDHGHTTVYLRLPEGQFFFDPNCGAYQLPRGNEEACLLDLLQEQGTSCYTTKQRFYKVI